MHVCVYLHVCVCVHQIVDFIVMDASIISVDHRIKPDIVVTVLGHDMQQAM